MEAITVAIKYNTFVKMKRDYYMHQQFLMNVDFRGSCLSNYIYTGIPQPAFGYLEEKNLFDESVIERCIFYAIYFEGI